MKNFFKKLSLVMALALVLTSLAPAASANAASKMAMNKKSVVLYLTENAKDTPDNYDFSIKNKPEDWKTTLDFKWESSNEDVATVGKAGLTQAVGVGVATISCTVTEKATGEEVAVVTAKVDVRANADKIVINNAPENGKVGIGEAVIDLNRTLYVGDESTTKRGVVCTNYTRWTSSDETVATVDKNGVVTTLKAGEFTITAEAYQSAANDETIVSDSVKLVAEASLVGAAQASPVKATVTFDSDMSKVITKDNLVVSKIVGTTPVTQLVKEVKFDATGKVATVEMYVAFAEKAEYTFEYAGYKAGFVGAKLTVDEVAKIEIATSTAVVNEPTAVKVKLYDANGIEITDESALARVTLSSTSDDCYFDGTNVTFFEAGKTAAVKAVFHTYKYSDAGVETVLEAAGTVVSVKAATVTISNVVASHVGTTVDWTKTLSSKMTLDDAGFKIFAQAVKTDGKKIASDADEKFTFESADSNALIVAADGTLYPVKEGTATVIVKYDNAVIGAVNVTVIAKKTAASLDVSVSKSLISRAAAALDEVVLKVSAKDQLGRAYSVAGAKVELLGNSTDAPSTLTLVDGKFTFTATDFTADGTYQYKVTVGNLTKVFSITAKAPVATAASTYKVELNNGATEIDLALKLNDVSKNHNYTVKATLVESKGGIKNAIIDVAASKDAAVAAATTEAPAYYFDITATANATKTADSVQLMTAVSGASIKKAATGMIKVTAFQVTKVVSNGAETTVIKPLNTAYMAVKDTQTTPTVTVKTQQAASLGDIASCFEVKVDGTAVANWVVGEIIGVDAATGLPVSDRVVVKNLKYTADVQIDGVAYTYEVSIPVNQSILIK